MAKTELIIAGAVIVGVIGAAYYAKKKLGSMIPVAIQDGVEAGGIIGGNFLHMMADPLDAFGIRPTSNAWILTTPWENPNDPVSNNSSGINFNLF